MKRPTQRRWLLWRTPCAWMAHWSRPWSRLPRGGRFSRNSTTRRRETRRSEIPASNPGNEEKNDMLAGSIRALARLGRHDEAKARLDQLFTALREAKNYPGRVRPGNFAANALAAKAEAAAAAGHRDEAV